MSRGAEAITLNGREVYSRCALVFRSTQHPVMLRDFLILDEIPLSFDKEWVFNKINSTTKRPTQA